MSDYLKGVMPLFPKDDGSYKVEIKYVLPAVAETDADAPEDTRLVSGAIFDPITLKQTIERETIERCAKVAEQVGKDHAAGHFILAGPMGITFNIASAIRALMPLPNGPTEKA